MRGPSTGDTLTLPVGNYLSDALRNYVSENPSDFDAAGAALVGR
jgi:hypothetical protein